jgi:2-oxoisovalerate dehydrogenase E2 component (dihydrolipoyl transacylase)
MATKVLVPSLGEGVDELTIIKWLKAEGSQVKELEPLLEVETDKVVTEIPSPASGIILKIIVPENTLARVGVNLAWIGQPEESIPVSTEPELDIESKSLGDRPEVHSPSSTVTDLGFLSPVVRKIAIENNIDLSRVPGTGLHGRITKQDVLTYIEHPSESPTRQTHDTLSPVTTIRRQIAERMLQSSRIAPHVLTVMETNMSRVVSHRSGNKASFASDGVNLTYTAYFISAIASALKAFPLANSSWTDQGILVHADINIGMATSLGEEGLLVPVINRADELSLLGIARAINDLAGRARTKKLHPDEVKGGTFTLTNHGTSGSIFAMPIINQPQVGILGVGVIQKRPVVVNDASGNDAIAIHPMVYLSFVFDHRILDGASADTFLVKVKEKLESWND